MIPAVSQTEVLAPCPSTEDSVTAYIERTLMSLSEAGNDLGVSLLPPQTSRTSDKPDNHGAEKKSGSNAMEKVMDTQSQGTQETNNAVDLTEVASEVSFCQRKVDYFQTDTSDIDDLIDSSGAEPTKEQPTLVPMDFRPKLGIETTHSFAPQFTGGMSPVTTPRPPSPSRPLSASARAFIRKYFTESSPTIHPTGHATVAFNEHQVHFVLRAVSDESVITSLHL